ncbi:hypothetical protein GCM10010532_068560 [Dactylosporangium siamense]|uniref:DUF6891 domain-containing protein n=2 Tax=Dactylosporangium siamense TaxID=685454 RepID=A0A919PLC8_9ACTN|nr:hypothetical protein Dsi01nite_048420 [Dactylosporangium siamense]
MRGMLTHEVETDAAGFIRTQVALGKRDCATIVADTVEFLHGYGDPDELRALAWRLVGPRFAEHLEAQATWPERTDSDRLTDAFRALDAAGIVAREDFACCQNCGVSEIGAEATEAAPARGYVFYHLQDAERAAEGGSLWLAYGLFDPSGDQAAAGAEVVAAVRAQGLHVDWDGSAGQRIHVRLKWARRRAGRLAAYVTGLAGTDVAVEVTKGRLRLPPAMDVAVVTQLLLPWLPEGVRVKVGALVVHREHHRLVSDDGRAVGRFDGLRLIRGEEAVAGEEPGLLDVTYEYLPTGPSEGASRPMVLPELLDVVRRLPTRTDSWLSAISATGGIVQMRYEDGRLWLETPHPDEGAATGKHASLEEAERMLTVLATEDRVAIAELDGVTTQRWH